MTRLAVFREDEFQDEHVLMRATVALGRHPENDIVLNDPTLSRFHARLERRGDAYVVVDLGAQNGVYLNGQRVTGERDLSPGDRIGIGCYVAIFDQAGAGARVRGDSDLASAVEPEAAVSIALDEDSLDDLSIDLDMSSAGVDIEVEDVTGVSVTSEASFFEEVRTAVIDSSEEDGGPKSETEVLQALVVPTLVLLFNGLEVSRHDVTAGELIIGRSKSSDVVISLLGLSRRHTRVTRTQEEVVVEDMGSQNGTWVNNHRIDGSRRIQHGDLLNYYEYGLLFLEDPGVEILTPATFDGEGTDELAAVETGRQDGISIAATSPAASRGVSTASVLSNALSNPARRVMTQRSPVPLISSEADASMIGDPAGGSAANEQSARRAVPVAAAPDIDASVDEGYDPFDGFDLDDLGSGQDDYLADALDDDESQISIEADALDDEFGEEIDGDALKPSHTQILLKKIEEEEPKFLDDDTGDDSSFRDGPSTGPAHRLEADAVPHIAVDKTSAIVLPSGLLRGRQAWPKEDELEPALRSDSETRLVQLEVFLDDKLYTQLPMSQPVVRVGTDARCELALPSAAGLAPWQFTLIPFGEVLVCYRASHNARVVVDDVVVDQAVLHDGDEIDLGRVRIRVRIR